MKKLRAYKRFACSLIVSVLFLMSTLNLTAQQLGANYNENIEAIDNNMVSHSGVKWIRGFVNVPRYFLNINSSGTVTGINEGGISGFDDINKFIGVKNVTVDDAPVKTILSFKLQFKHKNTGVPADNTPAMYYWMSAIEKFLLEKNVGAYIDILVISNEPMWETNNEDAEKFAVFQDKLIDLVYDLKSDHDDWEYEIYVGALNKVRNLGDENPIAQKVLKAVIENDKVQGLDLHPHVENVVDVKEDLKYIRETRGIQKKLLCTEVSLVWLWGNHRSDKLGSWGVDNGYTGTMKMYEWINKLQQDAVNGNPVDPGLFMSYFNSRTWYPQNWFIDIWDYMCSYDVSVVTYGMQKSLQNPPNMLDDKSAMWLLNFVYNGALFGVDNETGMFGVNPLIYPDFNEIIKRENTCEPNNVIAPKKDGGTGFIFPNPVKSEIYISGLSCSVVSSYTIKNLGGAIVHKGAITERVIDVRNLTKGVYVLTLDKCNNSSFKFLKI